jgi:hypothetical protein
VRRDATTIRPDVHATADDGRELPSLRMLELRGGRNARWRVPASVRLTGGRLLRLEECIDR